MGPLQGPQEVFTWSYMFRKLAKVRSFCILFDKEDPLNPVSSSYERKQRNKTQGRKGGRVTVNFCMFPRQGFQRKVGTFQK